MAGKFMSLFNKQLAALNAGGDALEEIRATIAAKAAEAEDVRAAPQPVEDALAQLDQWFDRQAEAALDRIGLPYLTHAPEGGRSPGIYLPMPKLPGEVAPNAQPGLETLLGLLVIVGKDQLRQVVEDQLGDLVRGQQVLTPEQRAEKLAEIEGEIMDLALAEEGLIRKMERLGMDVARRRDAPAYALLAHASALPG